MAVKAHRIYIEEEGGTLDFNSVFVEIPMPTTEAEIPTVFGETFPNSGNLVFKPIVIKWASPAVPATRSYNLGITAIDDSGYESPMATTTRTLETAPDEPVIEEEPGV